MSAVILSLGLHFLASPISLDVGPLKLDAHFLREGERAPWEGVLIKRLDLARVITEQARAGAECDSRVELVRESTLDQIEALDQAHDRQIEIMTQRIGALEQAEIQLTEDIAEQAELLSRWRWGSAAVVGGLVSSIVALSVL
jgi:hypothetical protein